MKKIMLVLVAVLTSTFVFAINPGDESSSSAAIVKSNGSSLVKVYYSSQAQSNVKVSIMDKTGRIIYADKIYRTSGFTRPYNLNELGEGTYFVKVEDGINVYTQKINFGYDKVEKAVSIVKLSDEGKYLLAAKVSGNDVININVFNHNDDIVYSKEHMVKGEFAEVLNLSKLDDFTIEISDRTGLLKTVRK